jgi:2-polyprenyl-3-methyl-5-hydroxy-6-metoxy-1,4-benzoquinol methylase
MDALLQERVARLGGCKAVSWVRVERGYTPAERWVITFADGSSAFAKIGTTPLTAERVRTEHHWCSRLSGDFLPKLYGFHDDPERPLLLLEDLSAAHWPPPWEPGETERLLETLQRMAATRPLPDGLPDLEAQRPMLAGWNDVLRDPKPFLALGLCTAQWLARALPALREAQNAAVLIGDDLLHFDIRSDNVCLLKRRVVLVDWDLPQRGNRLLDVASLAPSLRLEGGPLPEELLPDAAPLAALMCGYFASRAGLPPVPDAPRVRWIQLRQLRIALPWAARALGLPAPDLSWAQREIDRVESELKAGRITHAVWHERIEEAIADAYLASDDPRAQSGKSGDEVSWRWSRELILDAMPSGGSILDVGCANGYLMESLARWGVERRLAVEPFGVDISSRIAALARRRLSHWADRIWVGNVIDWRPPRRFDLVHTGIDYVPQEKQRALIDRLLCEFVAPGGRLVFRPERVVAGAPSLLEQISALGYEIGGVIERTHPERGDVRRTVWLSPP